MLERDRGRDAALRAKLLLGVAGATAAATSAAFADQAASPPADPAKWQPYSSIGGSVGSGMESGKLDLFVPLFQNLDSLAFLNLGVGTENKANVLYNLGVGFRTKVDGDWIVGGYFGHDGTQLKDDNTLGQTSLGAELMNADWDAHINAYLADNTRKAVPGQYGLFINGTTIGIMQGEDVGYSGVDGEVGYRVFSTDDTDARVFVGGFHFSHSASDRQSSGQAFDFSYRDISGFKARAEVTVYDLDIIGNQSRLTLDGEIAHDDVRGTTGNFGATLRIPLGNFSGGAGAQALDELDRRMIDPVRRNDTVLSRAEYTKPEPVIIYGPHVTSQPTNTLLYVSSAATTAGVGTYTHPTTLADATSRNTTNAFIVLDSKGGPIMGGGTMQPGQTLVAGGETFTVEGEFSHAKFTHLFDPTAPVTLIPATPGGNILNLASNTNVYGITFQGDFGNAIYGKNVDHVTISHVTIDGTGGGQTGINLQHTTSSEEIVGIDNVTISNVATNGIVLHSTIGDGGSSSEKFTLSNVSVTNTGGDGIQIGDFALGGSKITDSISLSGVTISSAYDDGILIFADATGVGSSVNQTSALSNASITGAGYNGVHLDSYASSGATVTSSHTLSNITITNAADVGIDVDDIASGAGSSLTDTFTLSNSTVTGAGDVGISLSGTAGTGVTINQTFTLSNVAVDNTYNDGVLISADARGAGSSINQTVALSNVSVTGAGYNGIELDSYAGGGGTVAKSQTLSGITVSGAYNAGIAVYDHASGAGSSVTDIFSLSTSTVTGAGYAGVILSGGAISGASVNEAFTLSNVSVSNSGSYGFFGRGVSLYASAYGTGAVVNQAATFTNLNASYITGRLAGQGISVVANAYSGGAIVQSATLTSPSANNDGIGLYVRASANDYGLGVTTTVDQSVTVSGTAAKPASFSNNSDEGVVVVAGAGNYRGQSYASQAAISQSLSISNAVIDNNFRGVDAEVFASVGASVTQNLYLSNVDISHNTSDGVDIIAYANTLGFAAQNVTITGTSSAFSTINNNTGDGVYIKAEALGGGLIQQNINVYYTHIDHNAVGVEVENSVDGYLYGPAAQTLFYSHLSQNLVLGAGTISSNASDGVYIKNNVTYGAQIDQIVELYGETVDHNGANGFLEKSTVTTYGGGGFNVPTNLHSDIYIYNSDVSINGGNGIEIDAKLNSPTFPAITIGYSYLEQHITVSGSTVNGNIASGFVATAKDVGVYGDNTQYITLANSTFSGNGKDGASFTATQHYGPGSFGDAIQDVTISGSTFSQNVRDGLYAYAEASGQQGRAEQHFTIEDSTFDTNGRNGATFEAYAHDGVYLTGFGCGHVQGLGGGCAFVRQTVYIEGSDISHNVNDGIYVYAHANHYGAVYNDSGRPANTPTMFVKNSTVDYNGSDGLHVQNQASNNSYVYSYALAVNSHFDHNVGNGIAVGTGAYSGSAVVQKTVLYGAGGAKASTADYNGSNGVLVSSYAAGGAVNQHIGVYFSDVSYNTGSGVLVYAGAGPAHGGTASGYVVNPNVSAISQSTLVYGSTILGNQANGVLVTSRATGTSAAISQYLGVVDSTVSGNSFDGVAAVAHAYNGASANQTLYFVNDTIANNGFEGIYAYELAANHSSVQQNISFGYTSGITTITGNHEDGIYFGAAAFSGGNAVQTALVYDVNSSYNHGNGLSLNTNAHGYSFGVNYIYYSHVSQNLIAAYDTFDHNGQNGVAVADNSYYGGAQNQLIQLISVDASHNTGDGFHETLTQTSTRGNSFAFSTNITSDVYLISSTLNQNTGNGISITAHAYGPVYHPAFFGGYSYMTQHTTIQGVTADGNGGDGFVLDAHQKGRYSLDAQYVTMSGSGFSHNTGNGARFLSTSYYGPGGFGDTFEQVTIGTSTFSYNGASGLQFSAYASGNQGRAEQHVTITGSTIDHNQGDGVLISASAKNGTLITGLPCTDVQGLPGGCAFVRQNVTIESTDISYNHNNGIAVTTYANNYGAIYGASGRPHSPTLELYGDTITNNINRGLNVSNHVNGHSYVYQYIAAIDTHFDHNGADGIYASSYVGGGSTLFQRALLYSFHTGASASYNGGNGAKFVIEALGGANARDVNIAEGVNLSNNGGFGFDGAVAYADIASTGQQINAVYFNTVNHNGDGVGLYSIGAGAHQISYLGNNTITYNRFVGAYGEANFSAFQYIDVYSLHNTVNHNGTNYLFNSFGGSTQILN